MSNKTKGILCIMTSAFSWAVMGVFVRLAGDVPSMQKCLFRNLVSLFMAGGLLLVSRTRVKLNGGDVKWLIRVFDTSFHKKHPVSRIKAYIFLSISSFLHIGFWGFL